MGKTLILVQGINQEPDYLYKEVMANNFLSNQYDEIINAPVEFIFDGKKQKKSGFWKDTLGDIWQFYKKDDKRIAACRIVRNTILKAKSLGNQVDVLAHSLGSVITLCAGSNKAGDTLTINNLFMLGSPLGISFKPFRRGITFFFPGTIPHTEQYSYNFRATQIHYFYSNKDKVSKVFDSRILPILSARSRKPPLVYQSGTKHDSAEYLKSMKEIL
tara:strand:+ start:5540 stop:6187 length:648 start_codon:yes stop_codon:yes gene_type:complete